MSEFIIVRPDGPQGTRPVQVVRRLDLLALAGKLVQRRDPVSTWLWGCLSEATRTAIGGPLGPGSDPAPWKDSLVADVERVAKGPAVYDANRFQGVKLPPATTALLGSSPAGDDLVRLNRMVLAAVFQELRPNVMMDGAWLGKTDATLFVGTRGVHQITVELPGAETKEVTIQDTSAVRPLEVSIRWGDPAPAAGTAGAGGRT